MLTAMTAADDTTRARDLGLDLFRGLALLLMVSVHFSRTIPGRDALSELLRVVGETAPAFFFYAFGLTAPYFVRKDRAGQRRALRAFAYVAVLHNVFMSNLFTIDFLAFLFAWNLAIFIVAGQISPSRRAVGLLTGALLAAFALLPAQDVQNLFKLLMSGAFPVMPWGLFVLAGIAWRPERTNSARSMHALFVGLIVLALGLHVVYYATGFTGLRLGRGPLSATYVLLLIGLAGALRLALGSAGEALARYPRAARVLGAPSRHLLLATVLHYGPVHLVDLGVRTLAPADLPGRYPGAFITLGSLTSFVLLGGLLTLCVTGWRRLRDTRPVAWLRRVRHLMALVLIPSVAILTAASRAALGGEGSAGVYWARLLVQPGIVYILAMVLVWSAMLYYALEER
jgi:hypothetical protein